MRSHSEVLSAAYQRLLEERPVAGGLTEVFSTVAVVIGALSIEVGFKALLVKAHGITSSEDLLRLIGPRKGHDLEHLYGLLTTTEKSSIRNAVQAALEKKPREFLARFNDENELDDFLNQAVQPRSFETNLSLAKDCFEEWRYSYEPTPGSAVVSSSFVASLLAATMQVLNEAS
jgi:hypothetical protein